MGKYGKKRKGVREKGGEMGEERGVEMTVKVENLPEVADAIAAYKDLCQYLAANHHDIFKSEKSRGSAWVVAIPATPGPQLVFFDNQRELMKCLSDNPKATYDHRFSTEQLWML